MNARTRSYNCITTSVFKWMDTAKKIKQKMSYNIYNTGKENPQTSRKKMIIF